MRVCVRSCWWWWDGPLVATSCSPLASPPAPTHNQGPYELPYDTSLSAIRHKKRLKVRLSRKLNASAHGRPGLTTPLLLHATD